MKLLGRKLAVTTVKADHNTDDSPGGPMDFQKLGETIVDTTAGVGTVVVVVATTLTALRITERVVKYVCK